MTTEINKVEGFNPMDYARTIKDAEGNDLLYLDVQYRKLWFRLVNPNGKIVKRICNFDGNLAVVEARLVYDSSRTLGAAINNGFL